MIFELAFAFLVSLLVTVAMGFLLIPVLRRMKAGQTIREDGPVWHNNKQGTPTMGGVMFIVGIAVACLTVGLRRIPDGDYSHLYIFLFALVFAAIGFLDDYKKLKKKQNLGLIARHKFALQLVVAVVLLFLMWLTGNLATLLYIPFFNVSVNIPPPLYFIFAAFVTVGTVNSVNITDGVDGLATGVSIPVAVFYVMVAVLWGFASLGIFAAALVGGLAAFLIFNFHPAKVFMGDTGAMFIGGAVCAIAFAMDMPLILITLGIVFFIETLSDIIQISYFKMTKGKRVFKMAPLHHHFEMCGWSEYKLFVVFTAVSVVFAVLSYYGVVFRV
jgi:phospho-N-acetylmuramoyl-pentapeptide-transferase